MPFGPLTNEPNHVGFEVVTAVIMKSSACWDIVPRSLENQPAFQKNMSPPSSGLKSKPRRQQTKLHADLHCLLFNSEVGGDVFL
jgi:hypothetical protein